MTLPFDIEALTKEWVALWQSQYAAMIKDPAVVDQLVKMMQAWREQYEHTTTQNTPATATLHADDHGEIHALRRELDTLKAKLSELESDGKPMDSKQPKYQSS